MLPVVIMGCASPRLTRIVGWVYSRFKARGLYAGLTWPWTGMAQPDIFYVGWSWAYFQAYVLSPVLNSRPNNEMGSAWTPPSRRLEAEILKFWGRGGYLKKKFPK